MRRCAACAREWSFSLDVGRRVRHRPRVSRRPVPRARPAARRGLPDRECRRGRRADRRVAHRSRHDARPGRTAHLGRADRRRRHGHASTRSTARPCSNPAGADGIGVAELDLAIDDRRERPARGPHPDRAEPLRRARARRRQGRHPDAALRHARPTARRAGWCWRRATSCAARCTRSTPLSAGCRHRAGGPPLGSPPAIPPDAIGDARPPRSRGMCGATCSGNAPLSMTVRRVPCAAGTAWHPPFVSHPVPPWPRHGPDHQRARAAAAAGRAHLRSELHRRRSASARFCRVPSIWLALLISFRCSRCSPSPRSVSA